MKYEKIRAALAALPTEGPWFHHHPAGSQHSSGGYVSASEDRHEDALCHVCYEGSGVPALINGAFIAACNPTAVSALLSERDALIEALEVALETMENVDGANDCSRGIEAVEEALATLTIKKENHDG